MKSTTSTKDPYSRSSSQLVDCLLQLAIDEDLGDLGDITTKAIVPAHLQAQCSILVKQPGVVAGLELASLIFKRFDPDISTEILVKDGTSVDGKLTRIANVTGPAGPILTGERLVLNVMQRLSGVATTTRKYVDAVAGTNIKILDTRKTTPGMRHFQKEAVRIGGGTNHRFGLFDAILIKDNHVRIAGDVARAVQLARKAYPDKRIEVEVTNFQEVEMALNEKADAILLDNMTPDQVRESVRMIDKKAFIEVSGGVTLDNIKNYLIPGVDTIACGALTHSAPSIDISLEVEKFYD